MSEQDRCHPTGRRFRAADGDGNPVQVEVLAVEGLRVRVGPIEALDGTPVLDVKPVLRAAEGR